MTWSSHLVLEETGEVTWIWPGHKSKEEMDGDALLRSAVPQDVKRQQEAHGCADGCRGTSD